LPAHRAIAHPRRSTRCVDIYPRPCRHAPSCRCTRSWPSDERDAKPALHTPPPRARACDLPSFAPHSPVFLTSHVLRAPLPPPAPYASPLCPSLPRIRSHTPHIAAGHAPLHLAIFPPLPPSLAYR
jgi:hypothetical protein